MAELSRQDLEVAGYGIGLLLDDGDLMFESGAPVKISGLPNLLQALRVRILTPWQTDPLNGRYGLDLRAALTTGLVRDAMKAVVRLNLIRTLAADPRVSEVRSVVFDDDPEYQSHHPDVAVVPGDGERRRRALVEITFDPVPVPTGGAPSTGLASGSTVSLLTDVRW
jgi:hypothetical protein